MTFSLPSTSCLFKLPNNFLCRSCKSASPWLSHWRWTRWQASGHFPLGFCRSRHWSVVAHEQYRQELYRVSSQQWRHFVNYRYSNFCSLACKSLDLTGHGICLNKFQVPKETLVLRLCNFKFLKKLWCSVCVRVTRENLVFSNEFIICSLSALNYEGWIATLKGLESIRF